ncbi:MAG: uracil-DNA glycosylase [Gemmatimonadales bacterium]
MADALERYLRMQMELGGKEVLLVGDLPAGPPGSAQPEPAPAAPATTIRTPDWKKNAPPIPIEPGVNIPPPARDLLAPPQQWTTLGEVAEAIAACRRCPLCEGRTRTVPGEGHPQARLMFVGEGPGQTEDETGRPFVGRAGELLTQIIEAVGLKRDEVFILNAVKCRPPQNRKPLPDEVAACWPFLERQIELVDPRVLVALGASAAEALLNTRQSLGQLRNRVHSFRGIPLVVTYHPAALLRNPNWKKPTWDDIRIARQLLDR